MKLSILIPVIPQNQNDFNLLQQELQRQKCNDVEIISSLDRTGKEGGPSTGKRRQQLLELAHGEYIVFIDADDWVYPHYVEEMLKGCESGKDCFAINGIMTTNGEHETQWFISMDYQNVDVKRGGKTVYLRRTNHITAVKREIALHAGFPDKSNAEDKWYSDRLVLTSEYKIDKPMYHYRFSTVNKSYK